MPNPAPARAHVLRVADLAQGQPTAFDLTLDADQLEALRAELHLDDLRKTRLEGQIEPQGRRDWRLTARLGATVVQPCTVTLEPVTTRIDEPVERLYLSELPEPEGAEVEMPEDDRIDQLPAEIDLLEVLSEALTLAVPLYPRAENAELEVSVFAAPGQTPMTDEDAKPFASLSALRDKLAKPDD